LGETVSEQAEELEVEAAPLERLGADLLQVRVTPGSRLHGVYLEELQLPSGVSVSLVVRDSHSFVPDRHTTIRRGDELLVVTPRRLRAATERRLRSVSRAGRLADWLGEPDSSH
jgi:cell volume regulation protein A